ncbi:MAG TPA: HAMP domain-containing sensor histidine kinase, partial [Bacillota bacterium]|nr:HAMP domain-containing sensor histidine kinase [Bacillota bacterium]
ELEGLERNRGLNIAILSSSNETEYDSSFRGFRRVNDRRAMERPPLMHSLQPVVNNLGKGHYTITVNTDPRLNTKFLLLASRFSNGDVLVLSSPLAAINESSAIANRFFLFTGLLTILVGGIAVYFYAARFTRPILDLNDIAQQMTKLDFSRKYTVQSTDEIGQLGTSINSLSDQLDRAIGELTEANAKLKEDIERERQLDKMRKEFVSNVSHELKTPIALIQGYAEGLKLNVAGDEENKNFYCDVIIDESNKMNRLVLDLLDLSQMESGSFRLERTSFDLGALIDYLLGKYRPILQEKGIRVQVDKQDVLPVNGDLVRIEQVLVNYLNNAINHVDEQKSIRLQVEDRPGKRRITIFNSGANIPPDAMDKIWTSFYKVDTARTRAYGGTGLGLSVVRRVMDLHGNSYGVENNPDGVSFWFELDAAPGVE